MQGWECVEGKFRERIEVERLESGAGRVNGILQASDDLVVVEAGSAKGRCGRALEKDGVRKGKGKGKGGRRAGHRRLLGGATRRYKRLGGDKTCVDLWA